MSPLENTPNPLKITLMGAAAMAAATATICVTVAVALLGLHRFPAHPDPLRIVRWFLYFKDDLEVRRWLGVGASAAFLIWVLGALGVARSLRKPLFGAARFARTAQLRSAGLRAKKGIILGRMGGQFLTFGGSEHVLVYAPTRSGKGVGLVIPNLLNWPDSALVLDIKRENWTATAGFRAANGQTVVLFDPLDPQGRTARYNPLQHIGRTDQILVLDELQRLATLLFPTPERGDPFWAEAARTGFIGVGALLAALADRPFTLGEIYHQLTSPGAREALPKLLRLHREAGVAISQGCIDAIGDFCSASENTFGSVKQTLTARMGLWLNPRVVEATSTSDFDLASLRRQRQSIYLAVSPDNLSRIAPLYTLIFQQLLDFGTRSLPGEDEPYQVLVLLDEFARLGAAPSLAQGFAYVAGYGFRLMPVIQSPSQLKALYGPDVTEEIVSNCGVEVVFAPKDLRTAQDLSARLGYTTVPGRSTSRPSGFSSGHRSESESQQRRALMLPQELIELSPADLIVLKAGSPPIRGRKIVYYRERAFLKRVQPPPPIQSRLPMAEPKVSLQAERTAGPPFAPSNSSPTPPRVANSGSAPLLVLPEDADEATTERWILAYLNQALDESGEIARAD